ncbi:MAG: HAD-IA family hydrolase [Clostridia bacterium]|nr:HAD-IA family hydrolase [Clostridia bacterium]
MEKQYKLAIFDLDGTILDTLDDLADSVNAVLVKNGYPTHTREAVCGFVGNGIRLLITRALPQGMDEQTVDAVLADFKTYYTAHCAEKTAPYAGISQLLANLRAAGVLTAVLSNKADFATQALCRDYFAGLLDMVAGEREAEGIPKKPAPDAVFLMMRALGVTAAETVYIGDSEVDVETARNAGVDAILVSWGFRTKEILLGAGATTVVDTPDAVFAKIVK